MTMSLQGHTPNWDELPKTVKLNIIGFLEEESLTQLTEAIPSAHHLVNNKHGIKVIIPERNWAILGGILSVLAPYTGFKNTTIQISDSVITKLVSEVEGKKIRDLELNEIPGACSAFDFDKFMRYPGSLKHAKLKYCDIQVIHDLLTKCNNLVSFHYQTGIYRKFPSGPITLLFAQAKFAPGIVPAYAGDFFLKTDGFLNTAFKLNSLKGISITMDYMLATFHSDWHNVIYILLRLPVLPSVTKFSFQFSAKSLQLTWKTHLLILACLADFILKLPNLTHFQYHSTFNVVDPVHDTFPLNNWKMEMLSGLIVRFGSNHLRQMDALASNGPGVIVDFQNSLRQTMNLAAGSLQHLESLDFKLGDTKEHRVFRDFNLHLLAGITNIRVTDLSNAVHEQDVGRDNVYRVFAFPHENPQRPPMFDTITILRVHCANALIQRTSLTRVLEGLPQLIEVQFKGPNEIGACFLDLEDRTANPGIFRRLEKLSVENICLVCQAPQAQDPRRPPLLCRFWNLKELSIECPFVRHGIPAEDVLEIIASLRKLTHVHIKPMIVEQGRPSGRELDVLGKIGHVTECGVDVADGNVMYDFILNEFELVTI